jgi:hypothetical protein
MDIDLCSFNHAHLMRNKTLGQARTTASVSAARSHQCVFGYSSAAAHLVAQTQFLRERRAPQGHGMLFGEYATHSPAPRSTRHAAKSNYNYNFINQ